LFFSSLIKQIMKLIVNRDGHTDLRIFSRYK
jgi:hypothetical protein